MGIKNTRIWLSKALVCAGVLLFGAQVSRAQLPGSAIIPTDRLIDWRSGVTVGVKDGIRTTRTDCAVSSVACQALREAAKDPRYVDGTKDAQPLIQAAINQAPPNTYISIPAGHWRLNTVLNIGADRDNITLRGAGWNTVIHLHGTQGFAFIGSSSDWNLPLPVTGNTIRSGATKGSTRINIDDSSRFAKGQMAVIRVVNGVNLNIPVLSVNGAVNLRSQVVLITDSRAGSLSFYPPLYTDLSSEQAFVKTIRNQTDFVGIEDVKIDAENSTGRYILEMRQTYGCWVKGVWIRRANNYQVEMSKSLNNELRQNVFDELRQAGPNHSGVIMKGTSGSLVEDNVIRESFPGIEVNQGCSGNVFAYNFVNNSSGEIGIDTNHDPHNAFNLYEGNITNNLQADGYFGSVANDTLYRNWFSGVALGASNTSKQVYCFALRRFTRNYSIVGNIIGSSAYTQSAPCYSLGKPNMGSGGGVGTAQLSKGIPGAHLTVGLDTALRVDLTARSNLVVSSSQTCTNCLGTLVMRSGVLTTAHVPQLRWIDSATGTEDSTAANVVSVTGTTVSISTGSYGGTPLPPPGTAIKVWAGPNGFQEVDLDVEGTTISKGNFYFFGGQIPQSESLGTTTLPSSLYLTAKPSWFGSLPFPPFDPRNPNRSFDPNNPRRNYEALPAGQRFLSLFSNPNAPSAPTNLMIQN